MCAGRPVPLWSHKVGPTSVLLLSCLSPLRLLATSYQRQSLTATLLRCELSQRCVAMMWCFTRPVTKPPALVHTCGINENLTHTHKPTCTYHLLSADTLFLPLRFIFIWPDTREIHWTWALSRFQGTVSTVERRGKTSPFLLMSLWLAC